MQRKMKTLLMANALFLIFLFAFIGTQARTVPGHPHYKLLQFAEMTRYELNWPRSPSDSSPIKAKSRPFCCTERTNYGRTSTKDMFITMADYRRAASPPPPSPPKISPPTQQVSSIGFSLEKSPPKPTSTKEMFTTMADYSRAASPPPPPPKISPPTHQVSSIGFSLEKSPPKPNLASA